MLEFVKRPLAEWIELHPNSYPPTVDIICDGWATDGDPVEAADSVMSLKTNDGNTLLFIVHLSSAQTRPTMFPARERDLPSLGDATDDSKLMFRMASVLPEGIRREAPCMDIPVQEHSRGLIRNADAVLWPSSWTSEPAARPTCVDRNNKGQRKDNGKIAFHWRLPAVRRQ